MKLLRSRNRYNFVTTYCSSQSGYACTLLHAQYQHQHQQKRQPQSACSNLVSELIAAVIHLTFLQLCTSKCRLSRHERNIFHHSTGVYMRNHLPMMDLHLGLMMPDGRRWKSYSLLSTTTVCPALFPPCREHAKFQ